MSERNDIVKLAVDTYHGKVEKYSVDQSLDVLRQALIEANGGKDHLDYRAMRDGKCSGVFSLIEEILYRTVDEGLMEDDFFMNMVDYRNIADGDKNVFLVEDSNLFAVSKIANGTQAIRRQRLSGTTEVPVPTVRRGVRIYEELDRLLSGKVDFNHFIAKVSESVKKQRLDDIYSLWMKASASDFGGAVYFPAAGTYSETALLDLIAHVEAASGGKTATILGTKKAVRNLAMSVMSDSAKEDLYGNGFYGKFYGSNVLALPQRHIVGTTNFVLDDNVLTIIAGEDKPIKFVTEGDPLIITRNPEDNMDLTQELEYANVA